MDITKLIPISLICSGSALMLAIINVILKMYLKRRITNMTVKESAIEDFYDYTPVTFVNSISNYSSDLELTYTCPLELERI